MLAENDVAENSLPGASRVPVVAIGGSAGATETLSKILGELSAATGMAFIYIQNESTPDFSDLCENLTKHTSMPVLMATHAIRILADHVYVIPCEMQTELEDGMPAVVPKDPSQKDHMVIDRFFMSLSERQKEGAIGILLSGKGSDGTLGLKAIKVAGGITIVQNETAEFQSMPKSAITEGVVDLILSPQEIAAELERLGSRADVFKLTSVEDDDDTENQADEDLSTILGFVKNAVNVDFDHYKMTTIRRRVIRRMLLYKLQTFNEYVEYLKQHPGEAGALYSDLLINVTTFFRDPKTMEYVKKELFPQIVMQKSTREPIRIWVAACSTGQEAYSLAMILLEVLGERAGTTPVQIFASDLSEAAIAKARLGIYTKSEIADVSPKRLEQFFSKYEDNYRIEKNVRDMCVFASHNILKDPPFSRLDLVSCRNLLIYLDSVLQQKALSSFHYALNPEGFLLLGKSEAVGTAPSLFVQIEKNLRIFARRNGTAGKVSFEMSQSLTGNTKIQTPARNLLSKNPPANKVNDLDKLVDNLLLTKYVPASVVVDQDLEIIQFRGSTGLFLEPSPGKPSFNLAKMARPSLVFELRNIIHKARKSGSSVQKSGLEVKINDKTHYVKIEATPIYTSTDRILCLVLFEEISPQIISDYQSQTTSNNRIRELEEELTGLREDMHSIIEEQEAGNEELQSANEEIVSSNEELQSINEELETSKEEIESANEELLTINQELQIRNDQLSESYGYSEAILSTINEATLILDKDLRIKNTNKAFHKIFRIPREEAHGRMLYELDQRQWDIAKLRQMLEDVIVSNIDIKDYEVTLDFRATGEKTMLLHARKVVQHERQQAILLVVEDITEHRKAQKLLLERKLWFEDLVNNAPALIWVSRPDGTIDFLNKAWKEYTGQDTNHIDIFRSIHSEDQEQYKIAYRENFKNRLPVSSEFRLERADGAFRWVLENAKPLLGPDGEFNGYMGTCVEVHLQKTKTEELNKYVDIRTEELKEANRELETANKKLMQTAESLQAVLDSSPGSIAFFKAISDHMNVPDFRLMVYNSRFAERFAHPDPDPAGKLASELYSEIEVEQMKQVLATGKWFYEEKLTGDKQWQGVSISRHEQALVVTELDISPIKNAEEQQLQLMNQLEGSYQTLAALEGMRQYVRDRGEFLRATSHDLRGSFGLIVSAAGMLHMVDDDEDRAKTLEIIERNLGKVTKMLNLLLDYSRLESGQEKLEIRTFDTSDILSELCEAFRPLVTQKKLVLRFTKSDPLLVDSDVVKIQRIARNLIQNAVTYTHVGEIVVDWGWETLSESGVAGKNWFLSISDTGEGLDPALTSRLTTSSDFTIFTLPGQEDHQSLNSENGEGIGLFIVKRLIEMLDGKLTIRSDSESGTTIYISFPQIRNPHSGGEGSNA